MATILSSSQSLDDARRLKKEEQETAFELFVNDLNSSYNNAIRVRPTDSNRELIIDVNQYLRDNTSKVFDVVIGEIKNKITSFCTSNAELKFKYNGDSSSAGGGVEETKSLADGRRRKIKRSPSKKSIKSKRKY